MAEVLAAGLTGGVLSRDVKPLKAPEGTPHDLGQFYLLIDPGTAPDFAEKLAALAASASEDAGARMPGQGKVPAEVVTVDGAVWEMIKGFAQA